MRALPQKLPRKKLETRRRMQMLRRWKLRIKP